MSGYAPTQNRTAKPQPTVDLTLYHGCLEPFAVEIVRLHRQGLSPGQIHHTLQRRFKAHFNPAGWGVPTESTIGYLLRRVGAMPPPERQKPPSRPPGWAEREARWNRIVDQWLAEQAELRNRRRQCANKGRPIDMGGPRDQWIERDPWSDL